jgi:gliding motility-associated-like protein
LCNDQSSGQLDLVVQGGSAPYYYAWSDGHTSEDLSYVPAGKYEVTVTDSKGCAYTNKTLLADPPPIRVGLIRRDVSCAEEQDGKIFITQIKGGISPYTIHWSNDETGEQIEHLAEGTYSVTVSDALGCGVTESISIAKSDSECLFIPNAFSPNGDGTNDFWNIRSMELYTDAEIKVYNKWGNVVFESTGYSKPWDGAYKGRMLEPATYYYFVDLKNGDPVYQGFLMILR